MNWQRTCELIPDGVQTLSKMPSKYIEGVYPKYIVRGDGAYIWDENGKRYIDYTCALGAIILGYSHPAVNEAVKKRLNRGTLFPLPNYLETKLAEKIKTVFPSIEMTRFVKTGSEATSAAIKIARAYTNRNKVVCCGYHGWHEWYNFTTPKNKGCSPQNTIQVPYNDLDAFKRVVDTDTAAVILEPYVYETPTGGFLEGLRNLCDKTGTVLIFDEVVTGVRTMHWSAQNLFGVYPDLTAYGKALGNGFPVGGVGGRKELMEVLKGDCFVSSTFGGELVGIAAALAVIDKISQATPINNDICMAGSRLQQAFDYAARRLNVDTSCEGLQVRTFFKFPSPEHKSLFWQECLERGVFFGHAQFISYAHTVGAVEATEAVIEEALEVVAKHWENPKEILRGRPAEETLRLAAR